MSNTITANVTNCANNNEYTVTLSGTAEPDGGDHIATINFDGPGGIFKGLVTWYIDDVVINGAQSFYFTSVGESYELRCVVNSAVYKTLVLDYTVAGVYAPAWAMLRETLVVTLSDTPGCKKVILYKTRERTCPDEPAAPLLSAMLVCELIADAGGCSTHPTSVFVTGHVGNDTIVVQLDYPANITDSVWAVGEDVTKLRDYPFLYVGVTDPLPEIFIPNYATITYGAESERCPVDIIDAQCQVIQVSTVEPDGIEPFPSVGGTRWWYLGTPTSWTGDGLLSSVGGLSLGSALCATTDSCGPIGSVILSPSTTVSGSIECEAMVGSSNYFYESVLSGSASGSVSVSHQSMTAGASYSVTLAKAANSWAITFTYTITPTSWSGSACHGAFSSTTSTLESTEVAFDSGCGAILVGAHMNLSAQDGFWPYINVSGGINITIGYSS